MKYQSPEGEDDMPMTDTQKAEAIAAWNTPLVNLTPRQIALGVLLMDEATDEDLAEIGIPTEIRDR